MKRFIESESRAQATLFPERLDDWIAEDNPVRAVDVFVDELDLAKFGVTAINDCRFCTWVYDPRRFKPGGVGKWPEN